MSSSQPSAPNAKDVCVKCNQADATYGCTYFRCSLCLKREHVDCASGQYSDAEVIKLKGSTCFFLSMHHMR